MNSSIDTLTIDEPTSKKRRSASCGRDEEINKSIEKEVIKSEEEKEKEILTEVKNDKRESADVSKENLLSLNAPEKAESVSIISDNGAQVTLQYVLWIKSRITIFYTIILPEKTLPYYLIFRRLM